jgi:hypothetical protein
MVHFIKNFSVRLEVFPQALYHQKHDLIQIYYYNYFLKNISSFAFFNTSI